MPAFLLSITNCMKIQPSLTAAGTYAAVTGTLTVSKVERQLPSNSPQGRFSVVWFGGEMKPCLEVMFVGTMESGFFCETAASDKTSEVTSSPKHSLNP